jgi:hypothetical protein
MWQSLGALGNKRGLKAQSKTGIVTQFVATSPNQERSEAAVESLQVARKRFFEQQSPRIELRTER